ncbi:uncharacterized protein BX664DRAFT_385013 [Halteromyces radiatus]|uniref:uncharacterized protein n=1 Tax=Halteromyces radiatus TaxID=101107 RepID=UPI00222049A6|nr:uncharacterized protein BX664DRAFT_385013 [Halteromyces radiatus]KAI8093609.1 hypothetical protein BX664DRAFT_385013 [Halteromyces radiatus]
MLQHTAETKDGRIVLKTYLGRMMTKGEKWIGKFVNNMLQKDEREWCPIISSLLESVEILKVQNRFCPSRTRSTNLAVQAVIAALIPVHRQQRQLSNDNDTDDDYADDLNNVEGSDVAVVITKSWYADQPCSKDVYVKHALTIKSLILSQSSTSELVGIVLDTAHLLPEEWTIIEELCTLFRSFQEITTVLCASSYPTLNTVIPFYNHLLDVLEEFQTNDRDINIAIGSCVAKLKEHYHLSCVITLQYKTYLFLQNNKCPI